MFPQLKQKITDAKEKLEAQLVSFRSSCRCRNSGSSDVTQEQDKSSSDQSNTPDDITKAKEAIAAADIAIRESS